MVTSSPEILSNLHFCDYAVYTTDYSEPGCPLVGHGMLSWLYLSAQSQAIINSDSKVIVGRVCTNVLALFSGGSRDTLEVKLHLKPLSNCTQAQYLKSIKLYKGLSSFLPANFNHPAWMTFLSQNPILSNFIRNDIESMPYGKDSKRSRSVEFDQEEVSSKRYKASPLSHNSPEVLYDNDTYCLPMTHDYIASSSPPLSSSFSLMSQIDSDISFGHSSPQQYESLKSDPTDMLTAPLTVNYQIPNSGVRNTLNSPNFITRSTDHPQDSRYGEKSKQAKRTLSASIKSKTGGRLGSDQKEKVKVIARGTRCKARDRIMKHDTMAAGEAPSCENCGKVDTTWRRVKAPLPSTGKEKEYLFCNPCGLWYGSKGTMRPSYLWSKEVGSSPPEESSNNSKIRTRQRRVKASEEYVGPSIAQLLAQNVRSKPNYPSQYLSLSEGATLESSRVDPVIHQTNMSKPHTSESEDSITPPHPSTGTATNANAMHNSGEGVERDQQKIMVTEKRRNSPVMRAKNDKTSTVVETASPLVIPSDMECHSYASTPAIPSAGVNKGLTEDNKENRFPAEVEQINTEMEQLDYMVWNPPKAETKEFSGVMTSFTDPSSSWLCKLSTSGFHRNNELSNRPSAQDQKLPTCSLEKGMHNSFDELVPDLDIDDSQGIKKLVDPIYEYRQNDCHQSDSLKESNSVELFNRKITLASSPPQHFYSVEDGANHDGLPEIWSDESSPALDPITIKMAS